MIGDQKFMETMETLTQMRFMTKPVTNISLVFILSARWQKNTKQAVTAIRKQKKNPYFTRIALYRVFLNYLLSSPIG